MVDSYIIELKYCKSQTTDEQVKKLFEETLKEAQELGYAERNPEADVEGYDACRKIAILTSLAYGSTVNFEEVTTEGISKISTADFKPASKARDAISCVESTPGLT